MEAHYFAHGCFMAPNQLLNEAQKLAGIPGIMVQGRYDCCARKRRRTRLPRGGPGAKSAWSKVPDTSCMIPAYAMRS